MFVTILLFRRVQLVKQKVFCYCMIGAKKYSHIRV